jgi:hypothetical protein
LHLVGALGPQTLLHIPPPPWLAGDW